MTQRPGPPSKGKRDRGRNSPDSRPRRPKSGFSDASDRKFGGGRSDAKAFSAKTFGARKSDAGPFGGKKFGARKRDEAGDGRPRPRDDRPGGQTARFGVASGAAERSARLSAGPQQARGDDKRRRAFPDVPVRSPQGGDENRIAKVMARAGLCSRREAEDWIAAGRVAVNGGTISSPAINVSERDRITVDGEPLPRRERTRLFLYHKPAGLVSTSSDPEGRPTLFDALPKGLPRLMSVGRLDIGTEGLLLLTNDGGLARELELPETGWVRRYRVRAHGHVSQDDLDRLRDGVTVDGIRYGPVEATLERDQGANVWISFAITEGKNREVRNVLGHLGLAVNRLIRVEFGPFGLGALPEGEIEEVETGNLRAQLGPRIIARAGCDFSGPAAAPTGHNREERREQRHALRESLRDAQRGPRDADRDGDGHRPFRESRSDRDDRPPFRKFGRDRDEQPEKPPGRPRRGHAWRQEDAPLHRTYRGSRRDNLKFADEERPDRRVGVTSDRKGRSVVVERFGEPKEKAEAPARPPRRGPPRDRASGPRPSRPRFAEGADRGERSERQGPSGSRPPRKRFGDERAESRSESRSERPRKFGPRSEGRDASGSRPSGPRRPRFGDERADRGHSERPRKFGARSEGRRDGKPGQKPGPRGPRGEQGGGPRSSGPRPPRKH